MPASAAQAPRRGWRAVAWLRAETHRAPRKGGFVPSSSARHRRGPPRRRRKESLPGATVTSGVRSVAAGKAMSKGRAEAATGGTQAAGAGETRRGRARGRPSDPPPCPPSRSPRGPPQVPAGAEPALQRPGCVWEPAAGARPGQSGEDPPGPSPAPLRPAWGPAVSPRPA